MKPCFRLHIKYYRHSFSFVRPDCREVLLLLYFLFILKPVLFVLPSVIFHLLFRQILLGLLLGSFPRVFTFINPILQIIRPIAPVAFMPFIVFWFGIGDVPAIVIIFIAGFFPILLSVVSAVQNVDKIYYKIADSFGVNKVKTLFCIIFPAIFTQISNALRLALGTSWIFLVSGEMVGSQSGLGFLIMDTKNCMRFDSLLATMLTIGVIGFILDGFLRIAEKLIRTKFGFGA